MEPAALAAGPPGAAAPGPGRPRTWPAAVTLFFGAALIPETIATFNSPPLLLLSRPATFLFLSAFYGSVALLVREFLRSRAAGWAAVLLLGMAAGAINEGIIAGTWYEAQYHGYALVGSFDPAVAAGLTVFHALVSTVVPILLVELAFPAAAGERWLRRPAITGCVVLLALTTAAGFGASAHRPQKAVVLAGVLATVVVALAQPGRASRPAAAVLVPRTGRLRLAGAGATAGFFTLFSIVPGVLGRVIPPAGLGPWQPILVLLMASYFCLLITVGRRWCNRAGWGQQQTLAVITGALLPAILASLILPFALRTLEPLVTLPMLAVLVWLARSYRQPGGLRELR